MKPACSDLHNKNMINMRVVGGYKQSLRKLI